MATTPDRGRRRVFVFLGGQHENVGDVVLRRELVRALGSTPDLRAFVGRAPGDYVRGLELPSSATIYRSFPRWLAEATAASVKRATSAYVLNAGEVSCSSHDGSWHLALLPALAFGRIKDNPAVRVGVGARDRLGPWQWPILLSGRLCKLVIWRDVESRRLYETGEVGPDWAFREGSSGSDRPRTHVALSYRGDRQGLSLTTLDAVATWADARGLKPIVVTQVRRDAEYNKHIAAALDCAHVYPGEDADILSIERAARETYGRAEIVLSDRLHALIIGASCGALPLGVFDYKDAKVARTMRAAGVVNSTFVPGAEGNEAESLHAWLDRRLEERDWMMRQLADAERSVRENEKTMRDVCGI